MRCGEIHLNTFGGLLTLVFDRRYLGSTYVQKRNDLFAVSPYVYVSPRSGDGLKYEVVNVDPSILGGN